MEVKLAEGKQYEFEILNRVELPGTSERNFILIGPDGRKYLLPEENYLNYDLRVGQKIMCTVDKINCSGKVFLEPDHPYYRTGERYDFLVVRIDQRESLLGYPELIAWVRDLHGKEWVCPVLSDEDILPGYSHLACRIERIRKGELMLSLPAMTSRFKVLRQGEQYSFRVQNIRSIESEEFFILTDHQGNLHRLPVENFKHYGYRKGSELLATVEGIAANGEAVLEPIHPYYEVGQTYSFIFIRMEREVDFLGNLEAVIVLEDQYHQEVKVKPLEWQVRDVHFAPKTIFCRVDRIKKGRLFMSVIDETKSHDGN